jgi:hypothetical protein
MKFILDIIFSVDSFLNVQKLAIISWRIVSLLVIREKENRVLWNYWHPIGKQVEHFRVFIYWNRVTEKQRL